MPEIGSKISLISKADIRYEGRLFTVDPQECTIALANVRSFGTEDRETQYPIAPQSQVYDYILFRGSDIKNIRVVNNVPLMPNDPAIMQMQLQNQMAHQNFQPQFPVPVMGHMGPQMGQFGAPYGGLDGLSGLGSGLTPGSLPSVLSKQKQPTSVLDIIGGGSRSTTPVSLVSRKSPTADMGVQVNAPRSSSRDGNKRNNQQQRRERHDSGRHDGQKNDIGRSDGQKQSDRSGSGQQPNPRQPQNRGWNRGGNMRGRGRGRGGSNQFFYQYDQQAFRQPGPNQKRGQNKTIKFDSDYDFEQANNKFEELRSQLSKLKVGEEAKPEQVNGEIDKKDDSGNETGAGDNEQEEEEISVGYDKAKSFFDNISCEASIERNKGKNRTDWRQERKLNSETFGVSSTRRGGYRGGRGGYFSRHQGAGGYRGGYRGNYRGRPNMRTGQNNVAGPSQKPQTSNAGATTSSTSAQ